MGLEEKTALDLSTNERVWMRFFVRRRNNYLSLDVLESIPTDCGAIDKERRRVVRNLRNNFNLSFVQQSVQWKGGGK